MPSILEYPLSNGFIHNWLVAGPQIFALPRSEDATQTLAEPALHEHFSPDEPEVLLPAVDLAPLFADLPSPKWQYFRCREDHFVEFSAFYASPCYLHSWAAVQLESTSQQSVQLLLATSNPSRAWLNGKLIFQQDTVSESELQRATIPVTLNAGKNELLVRLNAIGWRGTRQRFAVQVSGYRDGPLKILIPTEIEPDLLEKRINLEKIVDQAYIEKYVYGNFHGDRYNKNEHIPLKFPQGVVSPDEFIFRLQDFQGYIFQQGTRGGKTGMEWQMARNFPLRNGPHHLALLPKEDEYYIKKIRFERRELFHVVRTPFSSKPYGTFKERCKQALEDATERRNESLFCEIAKAHLGRWGSLDKDIVHKAIRRVYEHQEGSVRDLLGLLGLALRYRRSRYLSKELQAAIKSAALAYRYSTDEPGIDCMDFSRESRQLLFLTCELLAGLLMPRQVFTRSGKPGAWHAQRSERLLSAWLQGRGQFGFQDWDAPDSTEEILAALAHLVDFSDSEGMFEIASVLMDKIFFFLAVNSYQGAYGTARARSDIASLLSSRLEATSGISRLMWGMGNFNENLLGTVSLAGCRNYSLPGLIGKIASEPVSAVWTRQAHAAPGESLVRYVNKVTFKTNDYMLSSAQDYHPGEPGNSEHLWQATLGADAIVYTNHPTSMSELDGLQPNLWCGNGVVPRLAQWGEVLLAIYQLPEDDWLGFTHAYFPVRTFDEYHLQDNWAFARKGNGYLALTAARGLEFITSSQTAFRELRSYGTQNIWVCHMGHALLDGDFRQFQEKILAMHVEFAPAEVNLTSLRGDHLSLGWKGSFRVNQQEQKLADFRHIESPYCVVDFPAEAMEIIYKDEGLRLKFI